MPALSRRQFVRLWPAAPLALNLASPVTAQAQDSTLLAETDSEAIANDYRADAAKVDRSKFPKYAPGQTCANCQLYAPDGDKPTGGCALFYGKDVAAKGWCSAWEKKAG